MGIYRGHWAWVGLKCPNPSLILNHPGVSLKLGRNVFATTVIFVYNVALLFIGLLRRRVSYILNNFSCIAKVIKSSFSRKKPRLWENGELSFFFNFVRWTSNSLIYTKCCRLWKAVQKNDNFDKSMCEKKVLSLMSVHYTGSFRKNVRVSAKLRLHDI